MVRKIHFKSFAGKIQYIQSDGKSENKYRFEAGVLLPKNSTKSIRKTSWKKYNIDLQHNCIWMNDKQWR